MATKTKTTSAAVSEARSLALSAMQESIKSTVFIPAMRKVGNKRALYNAGIEHATQVIDERSKALEEGGEIDTIELEIVNAFSAGDENGIKKALVKLDKVKVVGTELPDSKNPLKSV